MDAVLAQQGVKEGAVQPINKCARFSIQPPQFCQSVSQLTVAHYEVEDVVRKLDPLRLWPRCRRLWNSYQVALTGARARTVVKNVSNGHDLRLRPIRSQ